MWFPCVIREYVIAKNVDNRFEVSSLSRSGSREHATEVGSGERIDYRLIPDVCEVVRDDVCDPVAQALHCDLVEVKRRPRHEATGAVTMLQDNEFVFSQEGHSTAASQ